MFNLRVLRHAIRGRFAEFCPGFGPFAFLLLAWSMSTISAQAPAPGAFKFTAANYTVSETDETATITVTRVAGAYGKMQVDYNTIDQTAINKVDYTEAKGTLTFNHWQTKAEFTVPITGGTKATNSVKFGLQLANARPAPDEDPALIPSITNATATVTILQVEQSINFEKSYYEVSENGPEIHINVKSGQGTASGVTVDYAVGPTPFDAFLSAGSDYATADSDFTSVSGTLDFSSQDTQEIVIPILPDGLLEFNEDFQIILSNARGEFMVDTNMVPVKLGPVMQATITINNVSGGTNQVPAGTVDLSFNPDSSATTRPPFNTTPGANNTVYSASLFSDNKIVVGGDFTGFNAQPLARVAKLLTNGLTDLTFDPGTGANRFVRAVSAYATGNRRNQVLVGGGFTSFNGTQRNSIARLLENGALDTAFDPGQGADGPVYGVVPASCGGAIIVGDFRNYDGTARGGIALLNDNGSLNTAFARGAGADGPINAIAVSPAVSTTVTFNRDGPDTNKFLFSTNLTGCGTIRVAYTFWEDDILNVYQGNTLLFTSGLTNTTFLENMVDTNGNTIQVTNTTPVVAVIDFSTTSPSPIRFEINAGLTNDNAHFDFTGTITPDSIGRIVVGGDFSTYDGVFVGGVAELNPDGSLNRSLNTGLGASGSVNALLVQPDGKVVVGGSFVSFNGSDRVGLVRLQTTGVVDETFHPVPDGPVFTLAPGGTNAIYVGGNFSSVSMTHRVGLARLLLDGSVDTSFLDTAYNQNAGITSASGVAPVGFVSAIIEQPNGDVLIGGSFTRLGAGVGGSNRYDTRPRFNFARLRGGRTPGPGNLAFSSSIFGADENAGTLSVAIARVNGNLGPASVTAATVEGVATPGQDFTASSANVLWNLSGASPTVGSVNTASFAVKITDDTLIEGDETFSVRLSNPQSSMLLGGEVVLTAPAIGGVPEAPAIILDNDTIPNLVTFSQPEFIVNENAVNAVITVLRTNGASGTVSVNYTLTDGTAKAGEDYDRVNGSLTFGPGQTSRTFTIHLRDNAIIEDEETILLRLTAPNGATLGAISNAVLTIVDDDFLPGRVSFTATNYTVLENQPVANITVKRAGGSAGVLSVKYATADGTATVSQPDYLEVAGTLLWNDGETSNKTISVPIQNDGLVEPDETVQLSLFDPTVNDVLIPQALGARTNAILTILNDDLFGSLVFATTNLVVDENGGSIDVIIARQGGSAETVSVNYASLTNGTARAGIDYQPVSGTLDFGVGELSKTFTIPILDDVIQDGNKTIQLRLSSPVNGTLGSATNLLVTISDNETINTPAGSLDTEFDIGNGANATIYNAALQADGRIIVSGEFTSFADQVRGRITRLTTEGRLDPTFSPTALIDGPVRAMTIQRDGRVLVGGAFHSVSDIVRNNIARLSAGGTLDATFDPGSGADNVVYSIAEVLGASTNIPSKVLAAGAFNTVDSIARRNIARLNANGSVDATFTPGSGANATVYAVVQLPNGKALIGGDFTSYGGVTRGYVARINEDGSLDTTFDTGLGADGSIRAIAIQVDQKIVIGGLFTSVSGVANSHIARLNLDGTVDATFQAGAGANGNVLALAIQPDGKILLGGDFTSYNGLTRNRLARIRADGSIDTSINFGTGPNGFVSSIAIQSDRRIIIAGAFTRYNEQPRNHLARIYGGSLAGSGELEFSSPSFIANENATNAVITVRRTGGTVGAVSIDFSTRPGTASPLLDYAEIVGTVTFPEGETFRTFNLPVINDNLPEPDETLGLVLSNPQGGAVLGRQPISTLTIVSDDSVIGFSEPAFIVNENVPGGKALVTITRAGESTSAVTVRVSTGNATATAPDDYTAVNNLLVTFAPGVNSQTVPININDDTTVEENEVLNLTLNTPTGGGVLGQATATLTIIDNDLSAGILSFAGAPTVNENGAFATVTVNRSSGRSGVVQVDYTTLPTGGTATEGNDYLRTSGTLTFGDNDASKSFTIPVLDDTAVEGNETVTLRLSNVRGGALLGSITNVLLTIIDDDFGPGSLDQDFNAGITGGSSTVRSIAIQPDTKIVFAGSFTAVGGRASDRVGRILSTSAPDTSFDSSLGPDNTVFSLALAPNGSIPIGGSFRSLSLFSRSYAGVLTSNGLPDINFFNSGNENGDVLAVAAQADGKVIIGGSFSSPSGAIARLNGNGSLDPSFDPEQGADATVRALALLPNGNVLVGGDFTRMGVVASGRIARLLPSGRIDPTFTSGTGANGAVNAIVALPDGKILIGGSFTAVNGVNRARVARLNADGSVDPTFNPGTGPNGAVNALVAQSDGKVYLGGAFTTVGGTPRVRLARLNRDGSLDAGFDPGRGPDNTVFALALDVSGKLILGGSFATVNGFSRPGLARLNGDPIIRILSVSRDALQAHLTFTTDAGQSYRIEASTDLRTWTTVGNVTASGETADFTDSSVAGARTRFYRIRR